MIKGQLFESFLDADDNVRVAEIQSGTLSWRNPILGFTTFVRIVTEAGLDRYIEMIARDSQVMIEVAATHIEANAD